MPAELTTPRPDANTYGFTCLEHPSHNRDGLSLAHAQNAVAKHNRDHHADPVLDVTSLAALILEAWDEWHAAIQDGLKDLDVAHKATPLQRRYTHLMEAWTTLTGMDQTHALEYARQVGTLHTHVRAAILPF